MVVVRRRAVHPEMWRTFERVGVGLLLTAFNLFAKRNHAHHQGYTRDGVPHRNSDINRVQTGIWTVKGRATVKKVSGKSA